MSFKITSDVSAGGARVQAAPFSTYPASGGFTLVAYFKALATNSMPDNLLALCDFDFGSSCNWGVRLSGTDPAMSPGVISFNTSGVAVTSFTSATDIQTELASTWHCLIAAWRDDAGTKKVKLSWGAVGGTLTHETEQTLSAHTIANIDTCCVGTIRYNNTDPSVRTARGWLAHAAVFDEPITDTGVLDEFLTYTPEAVAYRAGIEDTLAVYWELLNDLNAHTDFGGSTYNLTPIGVNYISGDADNPSLTEWSGGAAADSYLLVPRRQWFVPRTVIQY